MSQEQEQEHLPPNWRKHVSKTHGQIYYYNSLTKESQWELPNTATTNNYEGTNTKELKIEKTQNQIFYGNLKTDNNSTMNNSDKTHLEIHNSTNNDGKKLNQEKGNNHHHKIIKMKKKKKVLQRKNHFQ